jgi:hypothetical protein
MAQTLNYLKVTGLARALIVNFAPPSLEYKRMVLSQEKICGHPVNLISALPALRPFGLTFGESISRFPTARLRFSHPRISEKPSAVDGVEPL